MDAKYKGFTVFSIDTVHIKVSDVKKMEILASPSHAQCLLPATACRISRSTTATRQQIRLIEGV